MFKHIFVTTDGSAVGDAALPLAASLARAEGAAITVAYALPDLIGVYEGPYTLDYKRAEASLREAGRRTLEAAAAQLGPGVKTLLLDGNGQDVAECLLHAAEREGADVIVMSTHGRSGLGRLLLGSVAERVLHHARIPVLLVRHPSGPVAKDEGLPPG